MNTLNQQKWQEINYILENYKNEEMIKRGYGSYLEFDKYLKDLKKAIFSVKNEEKQSLILTKVRDFIIAKIKDQKGVIETVNSSYAKALDLKKETIESLKSKNEKPYYLNEEFKKSTINKIEEFYNSLENYSFEELLEFEKEYNTKLKENSVVFGQEKARGQIIGSLNRGMYDKTREEIVKELKQKNAKVSNDSRLIEYLSPNLLKYRIIALRMTNAYCDKFLKRNLSNSEIFLNSDDYEEMRTRTKNLGVIIKEIYESKFHITPHDEIINNFNANQITIDEWLNNKEKKPR